MMKSGHRVKESTGTGGFRRRVSFECRIADSIPSNSRDLTVNEAGTENASSMVSW